ncbi:MAG: hypothetical protein H8E85_01485 [Candidatus Marinimicrobia bacterium]|nr:hypothetical protein [Candidatus Neomarinimicrobiota bacterium]
MGYTQIPNWLLDSPNDLTCAEERVLMRIYRLTIGYHRYEYNISYAKITEMSGVQKVSPIMQSLRKKGFINYNANNGKISEIKILEPVTSGHHTSNLRSLHQSPQVNGSRPAKETIKDNINKDILFIEFKNRYPELRFDETDTLDAWRTLTLPDRKLAVAVMEYQNNKWVDTEPKYIRKASNWLLKRTFDDDDIRKPYEDKLRRKKEKIEQQKYHREAEEDAASTEEIKEILFEAKRRKCSSP